MNHELSGDAKHGEPPLRIAVIGVRGVPAHFGGSETAVEEMGWRMAEAGDLIAVYCRRHNSSTAERHYRGMDRIVLPSINTFNFDTLSHSLISAVHVLLTNSGDVVHLHGVGNGLVLPLFALSRKRLVVTIDGPDWERPKWGWIARAALRAGAWLSVRLADALIIDNHPARRLFADEYQAQSTYIPYGADLEKPVATDYLSELGLASQGYVLFVGALVPDKGPDMLLEAYARVRTDKPLIVVGDSPFFKHYQAELRRRAAADPRVRLLGYVYGRGYRQLLANAYAYVHPLRSDGTSPALLQALAYENCVVANSVPEVLSAVGDAVVAYRRDDPADLATKLQQVLDDPQLADQYRRRAVEQVRKHYSWEVVTADHRALFRSLMDRETRLALAPRRKVEA